MNERINFNDENLVKIAEAGIVTEENHCCFSNEGMEKYNIFSDLGYTVDVNL